MSNTNNKKHWFEPECTLEQMLDFTTKLWEWLGIEGKPTVEQIIDRSTVEMETVLMMRKVEEIEKKKKKEFKKKFI